MGYYGLFLTSHVTLTGKGRCIGITLSCFSHISHTRKWRSRSEIWHLLQSPLSDDVKYCASFWNSLAQASAPLMQWKQPPLFKWLFDLIYFIIQIPEWTWAIVLMIVQRGVWLLLIGLVFSTVILNHKSIPGIHFNNVKLWWLLPSRGGMVNCSFVADNLLFWNTCVYVGYNTVTGLLCCSSWGFFHCFSQ